MKKESKQKGSRKSNPDLAESYLTFLGTQHLCQDGKMRQHAPTKLIDVFRQVHLESQIKKPKYDLSACISGTDPDFKGRVLWLSDLHWFHENIIKFVGHNKRPFENAEEMNSVILANILNTVSHEDIVIFVGDITFEKSEDGTYPLTNAMLREIRSRCAHMINVIGNHDVDKRNGVMKLGFDEVYSSLTLDFSGTPILVSHYPVDVATLDMIPGCINVHGHLHAHLWESPLLDSLYPADSNEFRHVSANLETLTNLSPMTLNELIARPGPKVSL